MDYIKEFKKYYKNTKEKIDKKLEKFNKELVKEDNELIKSNLELFSNLNSEGKLVRGTLVNLGYYLLMKIGEKTPKVFKTEWFLNIISVIILVGIITLL